MFAHKDLIVEIEKLQKFALRLTRNKPDADDLVQSACLRAIEKAEYFEEGTNLFAWTSKIMYNIFVSAYQRRIKFETQYDPEPFLQKQFIKPAQYSYMEFAEVRSAMNQLSENYRSIIILVCFEGRRYQEVADFLNVPLGTVRSRLSRARSELQYVMDRALPAVATLDMPVIPAYMASNAMRHLQ